MCDSHVVVSIIIFIYVQNKRHYSFNVVARPELGDNQPFIKYMTMSATTMATQQRGEVSFDLHPCCRSAIIDL